MDLGSRHEFLASQGYKMVKLKLVKEIEELHQMESSMINEGILVMSENL